MAKIVEEQCSYLSMHNKKQIDSEYCAEKLYITNTLLLSRVEGKRTKLPTNHDEFNFPTHTSPAA